MTNSAHDTGVVSERGIVRRNWWCNFRPATARIKPNVRGKKSSSNSFLGHMPICGRIGVGEREKLAIVASMREVLCATPSAKYVDLLREHSFLSKSVNDIDYPKYRRTMPSNGMALAGQLRPTRPHLSA